MTKEELDAIRTCAATLVPNESYMRYRYQVDVPKLLAEIEAWQRGGISQSDEIKKLMAEIDRMRNAIKGALEFIGEPQGYDMPVETTHRLLSEILYQRPHED